MELQGRVALVTGAGSGIGRAVALRLAREGAAVVVDDIEPEPGRETVSRIEANGGRAAFVRADVADDADVRRMIAFTLETFGELAVLVNNAGADVLPPYFPEGEPHRWLRVLDVYLRGTMLCTHHGLRPMRRRGGGVIVNMASGAGLGLGPAGIPEYAAAKAGVVRLTAALASLATSANVRVNCICPGWVDTPMTRRTLRERTPDELPGPAPTVLVAAEDVADDVVALVHDDSLAGGVMLHFEGNARRLLPVDPH